MLMQLNSSAVLLYTTIFANMRKYSFFLNSVLWDLNILTLECYFLYIYELVNDTINFSLILDYSYLISVCHFLTWNMNSIHIFVSSWSGLKTERIGVFGMPLEDLQGKLCNVNQISWWKSSWICFFFGSAPSQCGSIELVFCWICHILNGI